MAEHPDILGDVSRYPVSFDELVFEFGSYGQNVNPNDIARPSYAATLAENQCIYKPAIIQVIFFGKYHYVTDREFAQKAKDYNKILAKEALLLLDSVNSQEKIYHQWAYPTDSWASTAVAFSVSKTDDARRTLRKWFGMVQHAPKPDEAWFDLIGSDISKVMSKLGSSTKLEDKTLHDCGYCLHFLRMNTKKILGEFDAFRNGAIDTAEGMTKGLETVEGTSFQVLGLVPTIMGWDIFRETAYKIGLIIVRTTARAGGAWLAETDVALEAINVLKQDVPPLICDLVMKKLDGYMKMVKAGPSKEFARAIISQHVEFACDLTLLIIEKGRNIQEEDIKQLAINRLAGCVATFVGAVAGTSPNDSAIKKWTLAALESLCNTLFRDITAAMRENEGKSPPPSMMELLLKEWPWMIVKIIQGTIIGGMQRQATTAAHIRESTQEPEGEGLWDSTRVTAKYLHTQSASAIFSGRYVGTRRNLDHPLFPLSTSVVQHWSAELHVNEKTLAQMVRAMHDRGEFLMFRLPNEFTPRHEGELGKWPKPSPVGAKTANIEGEFAGLVVRPSEKTHKNVEDAKAQWEKHKEKTRAAGNFVREDGLLFHPDMLSDVAVHDHDIALANRAIAILKGTKNFEIKAEDFKNDPEAYAFLNRAKVGYHSDIDTADVVNATTGERILLGRGNETSTTQLQIARINQDNLDKSINIYHDYQSLGIPEPAPGQSLGPHRLSTQQHGNDWSFFKGPHDGDIGVIGPDGFITKIRSRLSSGTPEEHARDTMAQCDALLQSKVAGPSQIHDDPILQMPRVSVAQRTQYEDAHGTGKISTSDVERRTRYYDQQGRSPAGKSITSAKYPISDNEVVAGMIHRGMIPLGEYRNPNERGSDAFIVAQKKYKTLFAKDTEGRNFVIAAHATTTIGETLLQLARSAIDVGLLDHSAMPLSNSRVTLWFELYTSFIPVTTDHVLNRIGEKDHGITKKCRGLTGLSSAPDNESGRKKLYAFCTAGFSETYVPSPQEYSRGLKRLYALKQNDTSNVPPYPRIKGLWLNDVWQDPATNELLSEATTIGNRRVVVFNTAIVSFPPSVKPMLMPLKEQRQSQLLV